LRLARRYFSPAARWPSQRDDGLAAKAQQIIGGDPFSGHLFLFRGKRSDYLKALYWDGSGLCCRHSQCWSDKAAIRC
jgi:hypothetical protein